MACIKRERDGSCSHTQCPHSDQSGYECVDIQSGFCEVGLYCVPQCTFSFDKTKADEAYLAFITAYAVDDAPDINLTSNPIKE